MRTDHGLWRVTLDRKTYVLEVGHGWVDLRPGREKGCKEANVRMKALAAQIHGLHGTARVNVKNFSHFVSPIRAQTLTLGGKPEHIPAFCGGCGEDGPGCPACERTEAGRLRYDAMEILGVVVRRLELMGLDFRIEDWPKTLLLARVTVALRSKDSNPVDKECLLVEGEKGKRVYLPAHPSWYTEGMPRWRKQMSLFEETDGTDLRSDGKTLGTDLRSDGKTLSAAGEAPAGDSLQEPRAARPGDAARAVGHGEQASLLLDAG